MWEFFWARAVITSPKQERDLLINCASFSLSPVTSDLSTRSLPARSTKCKQLRMELPDVSLPWTCTVSTLRHVDQPYQCLKQPQIISIYIHIYKKSRNSPVGTTTPVVHCSRTDSAINLTKFHKGHNIICRLHRTQFSIWKAHPIVIAAPDF